MRHTHINFVYAKLPDAGLGNMLLVWAEAIVFAKEHGYPLHVSKWWRIKIGPYLRGERTKRNYLGYFRKPKKAQSLIDFYLFQLKNPKVIKEPLTKKFILSKTNLFVFNQIPHWSDYFKNIKEQRNFIREELYNLLSKKILQKIENSPSPIIGLHIRRGDFRELKPEEDFKKVGCVRTPLSYFADLILNIRKVSGNTLPVTIFTDGYAGELQPLLDLPEVKMAEINEDIVDLFLLSRSKLIITSPSSTFSYWAAFLSDSPAIRHIDHIHQAIRPLSINSKYFEGGVTQDPTSWNSMLIENIKNITLC